GTGVEYRFVTLKLQPNDRVAELIVRGPDAAPPADANGIDNGSWSLRAFRELDDALLRLRINHLDVGTVLLKTQGDAKKVLQWDAFLEKQKSHWLGREVLH